MKASPDLNDVLRDHGPDAVRAHIDKAKPFANGADHSDQRGADTPPEELRFVDTSAWRVDDGVPDREWGVREIFPRRNVCLLSGEGAAGKTLLALQLGVAHALGRDWIGRLPEPGKFLYFGAEDDGDEIHRRLASILKHYGADFPDVDGKIFLLCFAGEDAVLGHADRDGLVKATPLFSRLLAAVTTIKPTLIVLDTAADIFAGNENDRLQVRQFVGLLRKLAIQGNAYVVICSHPSLSGINSGSGLSGSTGWHNSVRARAYMTTPNAEKDEEVVDPDVRTLTFKKSNYGPVSTSINLRWQNGVWVPIGGTGTLEQQRADRKIDEIFLSLLDRYTCDGRNVSDKPSPAYAPARFAEEAEAKEAKATVGVLGKAMRRLFAAGKIRVITEGPASRRRSRLAVGRSEKAAPAVESEEIRPPGEPE